MSDLGPDLGPDMGPDVSLARVAAPVSAGAGTGASGVILVTVVFTFLPSVPAPVQALGGGSNPDLGPDVGPDIRGRPLADINERPLAAVEAASDVAGLSGGTGLPSSAGQSVSVQMLDAAGQPFQDYQPGLTADLGAGQYGASFSVPPGFTGFARAILTSGPSAGQTSAVAVSLGGARDLSDVAWTLGPPQTSVFDSASNSLIAGSDGFLHVLVSGISNVDDTLADPTGNPVALAVTSGAASPGDFQAADWLTVPNTSAATGTYARLALSAAAGNTLAYGNYRVTLQISGTTQMRVPGYVNAGN